MPPESLKLTLFEKRIASVLGGVYMVRMFGLFVVLPVLAPAAAKFEASTPLLIGLALGIYGLPQAILQIPLGIWSDRIGRKPIIIGGLIVFAFGGWVAAASDHIYGLIAGRALQGSGAIAAVIMAFVADTTREAVRSKVMAVIGISIGLAFMAGLVAGPPLEAVIGLQGVFMISTFFALLAALVVFIALPEKKQAMAPSLTLSMPIIMQTLMNKDLLRLDFGIFVLHLSFVANFLVLPSLLESHLNLDISSHWKFYAPLLFFSFLLVFPLLSLAEKKNKLRGLTLMMIVLIGIGQFALAQFQLDGMTLILLMFLFFVAFNYLEANLPSLASRFCDASSKGLALGVFSQSQFLGGFAGGVLGGIALNEWGIQAVYLVNAIAAGIWLLLAWPMSTYRKRV